MGKAEFDAVVKAERERLLEMARRSGLDTSKYIFFLADDYFIPTGPPKMVLPPDVEPDIDIGEMLDIGKENFALVYYLRSGRYLACTRTWEDIDKLDKYRFTRPWLPDGKLPWEN